MEAAAEQWELFPLLAQEVPAKSKFRLWMDAQATHGPLVTLTVAASGLNLSRQRVHQLVNEGRIETVDICGERFIPSAAIEKFLTEERHTGVRRNIRASLGAIWSEADRIAEKILAK